MSIDPTLKARAKEKVVIIIPTYNEAAMIADTLEQVLAQCNAITSHDVHVLVFDSASTDNTQQIVREQMLQHNQLHLQNEPYKSGLGSAYLQAMHYALEQLAADIVFEFDADLSHQPKYLQPMLAQLEHYDVVVGSRYVAGGSIPADWQLHRKLFSVVGNYVARAILTLQYKDFTSGFRATRSPFLAKALQEPFISTRYAYKLQLMWLLHQQGARIYELPIAFVDRTKGKSKLPANTLLDSLKVVCILRFRAWMHALTHR